MGLDMYLERRIYVGATYSHRNVTGEIDITGNTGTKNEKKLFIPLYDVSEIIVRVAYWRKANQIHHWFTKDQEQDQTRDIGGDKLLVLLEDCKKVIASLEKQELVEKEIETHGGGKTTIKVYPYSELALELLPPTEGCFFGSYDIGEWYLEDLRETVEQLVGNINVHDVYTYTASY